MSGAVLRTWTQLLTTPGSSTGFIPHDNTIPQISEGTQLFSLPITPVSPTSKIIVFFSVWLLPASITTPGVAVFVDGATNAVASTLCDSYPTANNAVLCSGQLVIDSWTGSKTVALRFGMHAALLWYWLQTSSVVIFGTSVQGSMVIMEVAV